MGFSFLIVILFLYLFLTWHLLQNNRQELDANVKLQRLLYLLHKVIPVLRQIQSEQSLEREIEAKIQGISV